MGRMGFCPSGRKEMRAKEDCSMCAKVRGWSPGGFILRKAVGFILTANDWVEDKGSLEGDCLGDSGMCYCRLYLLI